MERNKTLKIFVVANPKKKFEFWVKQQFNTGEIELVYKGTKHECDKEKFRISKKLNLL